ncbi:MAG: DUF4093 domain-containing protein [Clostridia bacterium]|nr:DUF4093 domain-containing protein [Clostridia bacterium]
MEKLKIKEAIVVEGKYDQIKLSRLFDTLIIPTNGFDIYKNKSKLNMLKQVAQKSGIIILTDSDSAGFRIRNHIRNCIGDVSVKNAYIPEVEGKEKRKDTPSKEGFLGVEGISDEIIINAVMSQTQQIDQTGEKITKTDFFELGLTGGAESGQKRAKLCKKMGLPVKISANQLVSALNNIYSKEEFLNLIEDLF